jgi:hypothetical protein
MLVKDNNLPLFINALENAGFKLFSSHDGNTIYFKDKFTKKRKSVAYTILFTIQHLIMKKEDVIYGAHDFDVSITVKDNKYHYSLTLHDILLEKIKRRSNAYQIQFIEKFFKETYIKIKNPME